MAFPGSTFGLWTNSGLTSAFSGVFSLVNYTNLSDNPQDFTLYLGSLASSRALLASSNPGVDNIILTPIDTSALWTASTAYVIGNIVRPTSANGFVYKCTTAGTTSAAQPTWPITGIGTTVVDGSVIWALYAPHHPYTEIKLALSSGGLPGATGGAPLSLPPTISSGVGGAIAIYIRITNTVQVVSNNTGNAEIGIYLNSVIEEGV
jgi:hypothetical protein